MIDDKYKEEKNIRKIETLTEKSSIGKKYLFFKYYERKETGCNGVFYLIFDKNKYLYLGKEERELLPRYERGNKIDNLYYFLSNYKKTDFVWFRNLTYITEISKER